MIADMRGGGLFIGLIALLASCSVFDSPDEEQTGRPFAQRSSVDVVDVIDGDTFVADVDGEQVQVRLIGIDTPEAGECWADEATNMLRGLLGQRVELAIDQSDRDQYGRLLRYVDAAGTDVNAEMVRLGGAIARPYPPDTSREQDLEAAQRAARQAEAGLWNPAACGPEESSQITITEISADPAGEDALDLNGEYVDLSNRGDAPVDLGGWIVRDESASHRFTIPEGFVLDAGATVRLHTGCGTSSSSALFWCMQTSTVWNNDGDTVFVQDTSGNIVASRSY
jgi:micrococcal nuclease